MASINGVTGPWTSFESTLEEKKSNELGKEDFLKLLVAQLTHQDPTNPMQDTEFVSQLATYSGLEQQMTLNSNMEKLIAAQSLSMAAQATALIGAVVGYYDADGNYKMGQVAFIDVAGGEVNLVLNDKQNTVIPYSDVQQIGYPIKETETKKDADTPSDSGSGSGSGNA